jgi:D-alanyl-D-alanine endopeptidase (penicillin-binding protein 7)
VGTQLTRGEALHLALMSSENRAAHALARYYPGGVPKLVADMNAKAKALGMKNTTYVDPTGLSNENRSTARDLAVLAATASQNPLMRDYSTTPQHLANLGGRILQYNNSDRLVKNPRWDIELQKTGYIVEAGRCLVLVTRVAGHELIMVLLDSDSNGTRIADAEHLRRTVVAQAGWQDTPPLVAAARIAQPAPARHVAARHGHAARERVQVAGKAAERKRPAVVARKPASKKEQRTAVASAKGHRVAAHDQVAVSSASAHRVRHTFVTAKSAKHS